MADTPAADKRPRTARAAADIPVPAGTAPVDTVSADTAIADTVPVDTATADTAIADTAIVDTVPVDTAIADAVSAGIAVLAVHMAEFLSAPLYLYSDNRSFGKYRPLKQPRIGGKSQICCFLPSPFSILPYKASRQHLSRVNAAAVTLSLIFMRLPIK